MKIITTIPCRLSSTRLPRKILLPINDKPIIQWVIEAVKQSIVDEIWIVTTKQKEDDEIENYVKDNYDNIHVLRGDKEDIISRLVGAVNYSHADAVVSIDCEQPNINPWVIDMASYFLKRGYPAIYFGCVPLGHRCIGITKEVLKMAYSKPRTDNDEWWKVIDEIVRKEYPQYCVDTVSDYEETKRLMEK